MADHQVTLISGITGLQTMVRGISPFVAVDCVRMLVISLLPALAIWLPSVMDK